MKRMTAIFLAVALLLVPAGLALAAGEPAAVRAGDSVFLGKYTQTRDGWERTPIEWTVLDVADGKALVISRYGLERTRYYHSNEDVTWETSDLRAWLNGKFLENFFTEEEREAILVTEVDNGPGQGYSGWSTDGGNDTQDRVFLLSCAEANRFFGVTPDDHENIRARVLPTGYAVRSGTWIGTELTEEGGNAGQWWLRSPGSKQTLAAIVATDGSLDDCSVTYVTVCIRPVMWLDLGSEIVRGSIWESGLTESSSLNPAELTGDAEAGTDTIRMRYDFTVSTLGIRECGFTRDSHTAWSATVEGFDVLQAARRGTVSELIPFRAAIAWKDGSMADSYTYGISYTGEPITILNFESRDGTPLEEPDYILIAEKDKDLSQGWCYVISEVKFHRAAEILPVPGSAP